jgi:hypothetical protein
MHGHMNVKYMAYVLFIYLFYNIFFFNSFFLY